MENRTYRRWDVFVIFAIASFGILCAYLLKRPCLTHPWGGPTRVEYNQLCYNDLQPLYGVRNLNTHRFPYIEEKSYEYPVVIGLQMWAASLLATDHIQYFYANLPFLMTAALLTTLGLIVAVGPRHRILWFAVGTPFILYAFHNWDLLAVAPLALAMAAWRWKRDFWCGFLLGIGASAKLFPAFVFPALWIARRQEGNKRAALLLFYGIGAGYLLCNGPILLASLIQNGDIQGWTEVFAFHSRRFPDYGTFWYWLPMLLREASSFPEFITRATSEAYKEGVDLISFIIFLFGTLGLLALQWRRGKPPWSIGGAILALFLIVAKVHSPQYALWLLPFFVVLDTPIWFILSYFAVDLCLYVCGFYWLGTAPNMEPNAWRNGFILMVYLRVALLGMFLVRNAKHGKDLIEAT